MAAGYVASADTSPQLLCHRRPTGDGADGGGVAGGEFDSGAAGYADQSAGGAAGGVTAGMAVSLTTVLVWFSDGCGWEAASYLPTATDDTAVDGRRILGVLEAAP